MFPPFHLIFRSNILIYLRRLHPLRKETKWRCRCLPWLEEWLPVRSRDYINSCRKFVYSMNDWDVIWYIRTLRQQDINPCSMEELGENHLANSSPEFLNGQNVNLSNSRDCVDDGPSPNDDFRLVVEFPRSARIFFTAICTSSWRYLNSFGVLTHGLLIPVAEFFPLYIYIQGHELMALERERERERERSRVDSPVLLRCYEKNIVKSKHWRLCVKSHGAMTVTSSSTNMKHLKRWSNWKCTRRAWRCIMFYWM